MKSIQMIHAGVKTQCRHFRILGTLAAVAGLLLAATLPLNSGFSAKHAAANERPAAEEKKSAGQAEAERLNIMRIDEVRIGMRGYGLTVFNGTKIEPFELEVISVNLNHAPGRSAFWILSRDRRLSISGPVQGMSGSPIFLWEEGEEKELGEGGRLAGAFAFGFMGVKKCYAGITPIEEMLGVADRTPRLADLDADRRVFARRSDPRPDLREMMSLARRTEGASDDWRAQALIDVFDQTLGTGARERDTAQERLPDRPQHLQDVGEVQRLLMPVGLETPEMVNLFGPMFRSRGMLAVSGGGVTTGRPPPGIDPDKVEFEPGSMVTVPLGFGDFTLASSGTVTHVMPDGSVLAFGHGMDSVGDTEMPMATGFVHFIVPRYQGSFKFSGSIQMRGAVLRDESTAIVGRPGVAFKTAPMKVEVHTPGQPVRTYNYELIRNPSFIGQIMGVLLIRSAISEQSLPDENTLRVRGTLTFDGGQTVEIDSTTAMASPMAMMVAAAPMVNALANNPFEERLLSGATFRVDVEPEIRTAQITGVRVDRSTVAPGENLVVRVGLLPFRAAPIFRNLEIPIPADLPEGQYTLALGAGQDYLRRTQQLNPHRTLVRNADDLLDVVRQVASVRTDELVALIPYGPIGVAVDRTEMPRLPSSRAIMLAPTSPERSVRPFRQALTTRFPMPFTITGSAEITFTVARDAPRF